MTAHHPVKPFAARRVHRPPIPGQWLKPTLSGCSISLPSMPAHAPEPTLGLGKLTVLDKSQPRWHLSAHQEWEG